jgi:hypothetical protein
MVMDNDQSLFRIGVKLNDWFGLNAWLLNGNGSPIPGGRGGEARVTVQRPESPLASPAAEVATANTETGCERNEPLAFRLRHIDFSQGGQLAGHKVEVPKVRSSKTGGEFFWQEVDETERLPVEPDALFTLRFKDRPEGHELTHFCYEADRVAWSSRTCSGSFAATTTSSRSSRSTGRPLEFTRFARCWLKPRTRRAARNSWNWSAIRWWPAPASVRGCSGCLACVAREESETAGIEI